jgi:hypothetical protein
LPSPDQVLLDGLEVVELFIEMTRQQQNGVFQLALAFVQGALPEAVYRDCRADDDRGDQQNADQDQPVQRIGGCRSIAITGGALSGNALVHCSLPRAHGYKARMEPPLAI